MKVVINDTKSNCIRIDIIEAINTVWRDMMLNNHKWWSSTAVFVLIGSLLLAAPVLASETISQEQIEITEDVDDDLYLFGEQITIDATVDGDVIALG